MMTLEKKLNQMTPEERRIARAKKRDSLERREGRIAFAIISIKLLGFALFTLLPVLICIIYAFTNMNPFKYPNFLFTYFGDPKFWNGFNNFKDLFTHKLYSEKFLKSIINTVTFLISIPIGMFLGMFLAFILTKKTIKLKTMWRVLIYMPVVASAVAMGYIWRYMFETEYGLLNQVFKFNVNFFSNLHLTRLAIIIKSSWGSMGRSMILYMGAMLGVSKTYYEAAEIDGASKFQQFWKITFPLISPTTFYLLVMGIIGHLQSYSDALIFAPASEGSKTIVWFIWNYGINSNKYGLASAASVLLSVVIMGLTILQFRGSRKWVYGGK